MDPQGVHAVTESLSHARGATDVPLSDATKAAWASPNNKPMEDYAKK